MAKYALNSFFLSLFFLFPGSVCSQLAGVYNVPSNFASIAAAISSLNVGGVTGPVTINISAGYTETTSVGGYSIGTITGASATSPVLFQKSGTGANPLITAYSGGNGTPGSAVQDGIWRLVGSDYVTIDGIDLTDPNASNNSTMEFGFGLFKASATNGCQNNTIKNCVITLNRINNAAGTSPAVDGSRGINVMNALPTSQNSALTITSAAGSNSNNRFYANTIQNCNIGIAIIGFADASPYANADYGNDVGGSSTANGNTILNFGGGGTNPSAGIRTLAQYNLNVANNLLNNNNGSGVSHAATLRGIYINTAAEANTSVLNNTLSLSFGGTSSQVSVIENVSGSGAGSNTVNISNNLIANCSNSTATSGAFYGIYNNGASPASLLIGNNTFSNNATAATSGAVYHIYNSGAAVSVNISGNSHSHLFNGAAAHTGLFYPIYNSNAASNSTLSVSSNTFSAFVHQNNIATGNLYFIYNAASNNSCLINNNIWNNLTLSHSGAQYLIYNNGASQSLCSVTNNSITVGYTRSIMGGGMRLYYSAAANGPQCAVVISGNNFSNILATIGGSGVFYGIASLDGLLPPYPRKLIYNNVISNINISTSGSLYAYYIDCMGSGSTGSATSVYNNLVSSFSGAGPVYGFYFPGTLYVNTPVPGVYSNTLMSLFSSGNSSSVYGIVSYEDTTGIDIYRNKIYDILSSGNSGKAYGLYIGDASNTTVYNNMFGVINAMNSSGSDLANGIYIANASGTVSLYYNTVYLNAVSSGANFSSNALFSSSFETLNLRNNIFINNSPPNGSGRTCAYKRGSTILSTYNLNSNNNIFYAGAPASNRLIFYNGSSSYQTLAAFQAAVYPREINSMTENVQFISLNGAQSNYLHMNSSAFSLVSNGAVNITGIAGDYDLDTRQGNTGYTGNGTAPDIGADEYGPTLSNCLSSAAGTISAAASTLCAGQNIYLSASGFATGSNTIYQWKVSGSSGGPYTNVSGGAGANGAVYVSGSLSPGTYYYVFTNSCNIVPFGGISNQVTVTVNSTPVASASVTSTQACSGTNIILSAANNPTGTIFSWNGPNSFTSSAQSPTLQNVNTNAGGGYTLNVSASTGCSATANVSLNVNPGPATLSLSPGASTICAGSSQSLSASGGSVTSPYNVGNSSGQNPYWDFLSPYTQYAGGMRMQFVVLATELLAAGIQANTPLTSIQFPVNSMGVMWGSLINDCKGFQLSIGTTTLSDLSSLLFQGGLTNVLAPVNFSLAIGYNNIHYFSNPFVWNGSSNLIFETTFSNNNSSNYPQHAAVYQDHSTSVDVKTIVYHNNNMTAVAMASTTTVNESYYARPIFRLNGLVPANFGWAPTGGLSSLFGPTVNASPTVSTIYTVSVIGGSCTSKATTSISVSNIPTVSVVSSKSMVCVGDTAYLSASGAANFTWSSGGNGSNIAVTPSVTTSYTVLGTNPPCPMGYSTIVLQVQPKPVVTASASPPATCKGGSLMLVASGAVNYTWSIGANTQSVALTPLVSGPYTVSGTAPNSCTANATIFVTVFPLPSLSVNPSFTTICVSESVSLVVNGAINYSWTPGNSNLPAIMAAPLVSTIYTVVGTDSNNCKSSATVSVIVDPCTAVSQPISNVEEIVIYPNPAADIMNIKFADEGIKSFILLNVEGEIIRRWSSQGKTERIDLSKINKGLYIISVSGSTISRNCKIVIQ